MLSLDLDQDITKLAGNQNYSVNLNFATKKFLVRKTPTFIPTNREKIGGEQQEKSWETFKRTL